jgi:hypothetical protein
VAKENGSGAGSAPAALQAKISAAVQHDFAVATQAVLYGMAIALAVAFVVSLAYPRGLDPALDPEPALEGPAVTPS